MSARHDLALSRKPSAVPFDQWLALYRHFAGHAADHQRKLVAGAEERLRWRQANLVKEHRTRSRR
jgi:hypothetical protein